MHMIHIHIWTHAYKRACVCGSSRVYVFGLTPSLVQKEQAREAASKSLERKRVCVTKHVVVQNSSMRRYIRSICSPLLACPLPPVPFTSLTLSRSLSLSLYIYIYIYIYIYTYIDT